MRRAMDISIEYLPSVIVACFVSFTIFVKYKGKALLKIESEKKCRYDEEFQPPAVSQSYGVAGKRIRQIYVKYFD